MKKVVLSSVVALSLFALAVPAFAENSINGGANTPGAYDSREAYENQTEFVNGRKANEYVGGHQDNVDAIASQDPAVVEAKKALDAVEGGSHLYGEKKAAYESALNDARNAVRNGKIKESQTTYNTADKKQGSYYILNETPEQKNRRYEEEHGVKNNQAGDKAGDKGTTPASAAEAARTESKAGKAGKDAKAGQKAAGKALPKTSAVK
ncbi:amylase-binding protein [Streptococcus cristatus]|uniref:Amylase-binding protein n=1 Tax=Streptococcus cristatus TaxID=45634 RepID=A0A5B0DC05_STRCR|nr:amylase-binding adhesin AbpA [Streptococcus cristatus]KAA0963482.1 amylase-binding protein [Streptococcus cristatus]